MKETRSANMSTNTPFVFEKLREEALDLEMADKFLASVEQKNRLMSGMPFDAARLHKALTKLASGTLSVEMADFEEAELIAESELASWREILEMRNEAIETYHIRRFYDHSEAPLDIGLLVSLARVFRTLPYSESNQSKYDLVVTRLFTKGSAETRRNLRLPREKVAESLEAILPHFEESQPEPNIAGIVAEFDQFIDALKPLSDFDEFVERESFEALRRFKKDLGKLFFHPCISAAAIECNVTIGNVFGGLINHVNGPFYDLINNRFDFAGAFHDVSSSAKNKLWDEFARAEANGESISNVPDHEKIRELLKMIGGEDDAAVPVIDEKSYVIVGPSETDEIEKSAGNLVNEFLIMLCAEKPDYGAIRSEMDKHGTLMAIDLEYILGGSSDAINEIIRGVLALIIWTEELCANDLQDNEHLSEKSQAQAATLIQLSEKYQKDLQEAIESAGTHEQNRLLLVSNRLLASHLDLKRMLVRFTRRRLEVTVSEDNVLPHAGSNPATPLNAV